MGGISIWQLLIIFLIIGVPVIMYFVISGGLKGNVQRPLKFFHWTFWISVAGMVIFFTATALSGGPDSAPEALGLVALVSIIGFWTYVIALGVLANRTGRSWILWAGLTLITSLFGMIVSYAMMSSRVKSRVSDS